MMQILLCNLEIAQNVAKSKSFLSKKFNIPESGKGTIIYWLARGWSKVESRIKMTPYLQKQKVSPFSCKHWLDKINPKTGSYYTLDEANFERNSIRPIRKEYWILKGYSEEEAEKEAKNQKNQNNKKGNDKSTSRDTFEIKASSKRCKEYWLIRGYTEEQAEKEVSKMQSTFSLEKCIEKYGAEKGEEIWKLRQILWQKKLNDKPKEEIERINRAKMLHGKGYSNISQELFDHLYKLLEDKNVHYATLNSVNNNNNEYLHLSKTTNKVFFFDFYYPAKNKIIEFDGDYWHGEKRGNKQRDEDRQKILESEGFIVKRVKERDYKENRQKVIDECLTFLKQ